MKIEPPKIETVSISKLKPWAHNPRIKHAVDTIANSIEHFGYLNPIIVQAKTYRVLAGHGRLKALKRKKVKQVPVIVTTLSDRNADLYTLADNRLTELSSFDVGKTANFLKGLGKLELNLTGFSSKSFGLLPDSKSTTSKKISFYVNKNKIKLLFSSEAKCGFVLKRIEAHRSDEQELLGDSLYRILKG